MDAQDIVNYIRTADRETLIIIKDIINLKLVISDEPEVYDSARLSWYKYIKTWEYRPPLAWEHYLSWAKPEAYRSYADLNNSFFILKQL